MNQLNNLILEGTVINEPEVVAVSTTSDDRLVRFTIANDRYYLDSNKTPKQETLFMNVNCWGELGDKVLEVVHKGKILRTVGRLFQTRWVTKTGEHKSEIALDCNHIEYRIEKKEYNMEVL